MLYIYIFCVGYSVLLLCAALALASKLGDGCEFVFLDLGANVGVQARRLYEREKYLSPRGEMGQLFDSAFGVDYRKVCTFAWEPNPLHAPRLREMEAVYQSLGYRYRVFSAAVSTTNTELQLRFSPASATQMGAGLASHSSEMDMSIPDDKRATVPVMNFVEFLQTHIIDRSFPGSGAGYVLCKMDIEGEEYNLLPALMRSGAICAMDVVVAEYHPKRTHLVGGFLRKFDAKALRTFPKTVNRLTERMHPGKKCKANVTSMDDELYHGDLLVENPLPLYPGADSDCNSGGKRCPKSRPAEDSGMTPQQYFAQIYGVRWGEKNFFLKESASMSNST